MNVEADGHCGLVVADEEEVRTQTQEADVNIS